MKIVNILGKSSAKNVNVPKSVSISRVLLDILETKLDKIGTITRNLVRYRLSKMYSNTSITIQIANRNPDPYFVNDKVAKSKIYHTVQARVN